MLKMKTPLAASSKTDCKEQPLLFQDLGSRKVAVEREPQGAVLASKWTAQQAVGQARLLANCFAKRIAASILEGLALPWPAMS